MKKSTDDLLKSLKSKHNIEDFFKENDSELIFDKLSDMIEFFMNQKGIKKSDVVRQSMLGNYAYSIINGNRTNPNRDKMIMLCFGLKLTSAEANLLLRMSSNGELYVRNPRDSVLIYSLDRTLSVIDTNNKLVDLGFDELPLP